MSIVHELGRQAKRFETGLGYIPLDIVCHHSLSLVTDHYREEQSNEQFTIEKSKIADCSDRCWLLMSHYHLSEAASFLLPASLHVSFRAEL
jgi:hypothetical protein